ncbi:MAG: virulence RhuM family protein [Paludibacteraceae bacterium]|nr:virulence RhuM family protein [Paludibacteraceae bacterium]
MKDEIVLYKPNEQFQLEVQLKDETVWLNITQIALLFDRDRTVISRHIRNIYKEGELDENITCAKFAHMGIDADQVYETTYYNLDVIISVGYRVKSKRGVEFRQWANKVLKDYLLKGYAVNQRLMAIEDRMDRRLQEHTDQIHELQNKVDFFVRTSLPPVEGIFYDGQIFDAYKFISDRVREAKKRIILIDNYVDDSVLTLLDKRGKDVSAKIYTKNIPHQLSLDFEKHNAQYAPIEVEQFDRSHDRWLCIDDTVYHIGASLKDLGKKWFAFVKLEQTTDELLNKM